MLRIRFLALVVVVVALLAAPGVAPGAIVANGDFETGSLSGWTTDNLPTSTTSTWYAYSGTVAPLNGALTVAAPPQGNFAAITDQAGAGRRVLYQDMALPAGGSLDQLSLLVYYHTFSAVSSPDSLDPAV